MWCRRAVCLNECPRNLILASKVDVLEYIEAAERGEEGAPPLSNIAVRVKKAVHTQLKGNWGHPSFSVIKFCQLISYLAAHEKDPSGQ